MKCVVAALSLLPLIACVGPQTEGATTQPTPGSVDKAEPVKANPGDTLTAANSNNLAAPPTPGGIDKAEPVKVAPEDMSAVAKGNNQFAFDLYQTLKTQQGNLFLSPISLSTALGMTYAGARGDTATEMAKVMRFPLEPERLHPAFSSLLTSWNAQGKSYQLSVANRLWGQEEYHFLKPFLDLTRVQYDAELTQLNFREDAEAARKEINKWVEEKTQEKIKDLIPRGGLNEDTRLVLTNAIYFKGSWASKFDKSLTKDGPFFLSPGSSEDVPMMRMGGKFLHARVDGLQVLELPYTDNELSMVILLPEKADGLNELETKLSEENIAKWISSLRESKVNLTLPKFKMTVDFQLSEIFRKLGMKQAFGGDSDFSGMNGQKDLYISEIFHKAFVDVNEEGTEAAAATAVVIDTRSVSVEETFRADHPFVFLIRDTRSGAILFLGRLADPKV